MYYIIKQNNNWLVKKDKSDVIIATCINMKVAKLLSNDLNELEEYGVSWVLKLPN